MTNFEKTLDSLLVTSFRSMGKLEEKMLAASRNIPLSFSEVYTLEAVAAGGKAGEATISEISEYLDIRLPSATASVNKLVAKGMVVKEKAENDGRVVHVGLTRAGRRALAVHRLFHRNMMRAMADGMDSAERGALMKGIEKLKIFLDVSMEEYDGTL